MNGAPPTAAAQALRATLQRALSCVSTAVLVTDSLGATSRLQVTTRLTRVGGSFLTLTIWHYYTVVSQTAAPRRERWQTRTTGYAYRMDDADGREIVAYHWHPEGRSHVAVPHLHLGAALGELRPEATRAHLLTGLATPVAVLTFAVERFDVVRRRADWADVFERCQSALGLDT